MKVLLISPVGFAINAGTRYAGIERLVYEYAKELLEHPEVSVTVMGHADSVYPVGVNHLPYKPEGEDIFLDAEIRMYQQYQTALRNFDVVHDFSHQHFASRYNANLPSLNIFWHAPLVAQFPKSPYNIIGLSHWACREFRKVYQQEARYQQSIAIDVNLYCPAGERGKRFLTLGAMTPRKGNLEAIKLCQRAGVPLDVVGKGYGDAYENLIKSECDGENIKYHGEVSEDEKISLMQTCRALIFVNQEPEVTSHKIQEAMLTGAPIITCPIGALPEIITHGEDGYLCRNDAEYLDAIETVDELNPWLTYDATRAKFSIENVVANYLPLYKRVAGGMRW
ncbi:MAG: glycosyltransferase [Dehalococcoidales bacterium]|nr:glycosyltransferase [Dehalococcoidales bacterium]